MRVAAGEFYFQYGQNGTAGNGTAPTGILPALTGNQHWLSITVNGTEQSPRERLLSVPFALRSADAQKTDADLRKVVDAVGRVVVALGGNSSNLLVNPADTVATMESTAKNVLEMQKRFRVIALSGNLSFGNSSTSRQLTISNTGFDRLTVSGISYPAGFSGNWSGVVPAFGSQAVAVTFSPPAAQSYSGNITVSSDATGGGAVAVRPVSGTGARLIAVSGNLGFGNVVGNTTTTRNFTISNTGTMNLTVSGITYPSRFSGNWSGTIAPGGSQSVSVIFTPTAVQAYGGNLSVLSNASGGSGLLAVSGSGLAAFVTVTGGTLPSSSQLAGQIVSSFQIGKYEVTWGEWQWVRAWAVNNGYTDLDGVGAESSNPKPSMDNHPVQQVNWYDVVKWCNAKSEMEGLAPVYKINGVTYKTGQSLPTTDSLANGYRLPLEKEWEWAARGGVYTQGYTYSGSNSLDLVAWTTQNDQDSRPVGTKVANELGIYDMSGNVCEWCWDLIYTTGRSFRGGGFWYCYTDNYFSVSSRDGFVNFDDMARKFDPNGRWISVGFRLARNLGN